MGSSGQGCQLPRKTGEDTHHSPHLIVTEDWHLTLIIILLFLIFLQSSSIIQDIIAAQAATKRDSINIDF